MAELVGKVLNHFQVKALLGEGGMGAVYRAHDTALERDVALKVLHEQFARQPPFQQRFKQEARAAARLDHPGVVRVFEYGEWQGFLFIAMEFIAGGNLRQLLLDMKKRSEWIALPEAIFLVRDICRAVDYTHQQGVLHRDLKPDNIMIKSIRQTDLPYQPVLTDLGLAKLLEGGIETQTGVTMGTPAYMSPEQALGKPTSTQSDIYSLGVLLYELATGKLPFDVSTLTEVVRLHLQEWRPPNLPPGTPAALANIIRQTIQPQPNQRFSTAGKMADALEAALPEIRAASGTIAENLQGISLATPYQNSLVDHLAGRDVSFPDLVPTSQDLLQVVTEGQTARTFPLKPGSISIGRTEENDVMVEDPKISRKHARLEYDGQICRVTDLKSTNGTFLDGVALLAGIPETWNPEKILTIGDSHLKLVKKPRQKQVYEGTIGVVEPAGAPSLSQSGRIGLSLSATAIEVEAGGSVSLRAVLINQGALVDHVRLSVEGIPTTWVAIPTPEVQLMPSQTQEVDVRISPPRASSSLAKKYALSAAATSRAAALETARAPLTLTIKPYYLGAVNLRPQKQTAAQHAAFSLECANQGNSPMTLKFSGQDSADLCEFKFQPARLELPPGQVEKIQIEVNSRVPLTRKEMRSHILSIMTHPEEQPELTLQARAEWQQSFPELLLSLSPDSQKSVGTAEFTAQITNQSIFEAEVSLEGSATGCGVEVNPARLSIPGAAARDTRVTVRQLKPVQLDPGKESNSESIKLNVTAHLTQSPAITWEASAVWEALPVVVIKPLTLPEPVRLKRKTSHRYLAFFLMVIALFIVACIGFIAGNVFFQMSGQSAIALIVALTFWIGGFALSAFLVSRLW